jgi:hypothetical protein
VVSFLEELFADRVVLWGSHKGGGGWYNVSEASAASWAEGEKKFVWSGPLPQ